MQQTIYDNKINIKTLKVSDIYLQSKETSMMEVFYFSKKAPSQTVDWDPDFLVYSSGNTKKSGKWNVFPSLVCKVMTWFCYQVFTIAKRYIYAFLTVREAISRVLKKVQKIHNYEKKKFRINL